MRSIYACPGREPGYKPDAVLLFEPNDNFDKNFPIRRDSLARSPGTTENLHKAFPIQSLVRIDPANQGMA
jgi:hypothetical protein